MKKQSPIDEVSLSKALSKASQDHANDLGENNMTGHAGSGILSFSTQNHINLMTLIINKA